MLINNTFYECVKPWKKGIFCFENFRMACLTSSSKLAAIIQLNCTNNKEQNLSRCISLIVQAKRAGAVMAFLPEGFDFIARNRVEMLSLCDIGDDSSTVAIMQRVALENKITLSLGGLHVLDGQNNKIKNTHIIINDSGQIISRYLKTHLFDYQKDGQFLLKESDWSKKGNMIVAPVSTPIGQVGLGICYDLRFPEFSRLLVEQGAQVLTFPSAFTKITGSAHWAVLLRARAIENQCFVVAAAQCGRHNERRESYGHSMIVDPWGTVVAECDESEGVAIAEINMEQLEKIRFEMPVWEHRRSPDLYSLVSTGPQLVVPNDQFDNYMFGEHKIAVSCVFARTPYCFAIVNRKPVVEGHVLVIPIRKAIRLCDLNANELIDLFFTVQKVQLMTETEYGCDSSNVVIQDGVAAGRSVHHLHVHILPRREGDFKRTDDIYLAMDKDVATPWRSLEEMSQESKRFRNKLR